MASGAPDHKVADNHINSFRKQLLAWYDKNRRTLPWRAPPGITPDPYKVWLSEIMLQQTVVAAVIPYFLLFMKQWPDVKSLAAASQDEVMQAWAGLGYYSRARNLYKCASIIANDYCGVFPADQKTLKSLPGIGDYTSAAIAAIAFDKPATVVDGNVERVIARYFALEDPLPAAKKIFTAYARFLSEGREDRPGDFAQAMMDLGATICIPKAPRCALCPLRDGCAGVKAGLADTLPARSPRKAKPKRRGDVYWIEDENGQILLENRAEKGLLGGMPGFPTSSWSTHNSWEQPAKPPITGLDCKKLNEINVLHSFTHFDLELQGYRARLRSQSEIPDRFFWVSRPEIEKIGFPTVFKKFVRLVLQYNKW